MWISYRIGIRLPGLYLVQFQYMETQQPYSSNRRAVKVIQERHQGEFLTDDQIIAFVNNAQVGIDSSVVWFGYKISPEETPFYRFSKLLENNYDRFNPDEKTQFLSSGGKFVLWAIRPNTSDAKLSTHSLEIRQRNIGEYLARCLEFCQQDVQKSKEFIIGNMKDFDPKMWKENNNRLPLTMLYSAPKDPGYEERNEKTGAISDHYVKINPKIAELAFMLEADLFGFSSALLTQFLESVFSNTHTDVKTQIMRYISQKIVNEGFNRAGLLDISLFLQQNRSFYNDLITRNPDDQSAQSYAVADKSLTFHNLIEKTRKKEISADDLVEFLEQNPFLVEYVSEEELENARNSTKDHGIAVRIQEIRRKKESIPITLHL